MRCRFIKSCLRWKHSFYKFLSYYKCFPVPGDIKKFAAIQGNDKGKAGGRHGGKITVYDNTPCFYFLFPNEQQVWGPCGNSGFQVRECKSGFKKSREKTKYEKMPKLGNYQTFRETFF